MELHSEKGAAPDFNFFQAFADKTSVFSISGTGLARMHTVDLQEGLITANAEITEEAIVNQLTVTGGLPPSMMALCMSFRRKMNSC